MKCRELLEPGAVACVQCGTRVGQPVDETNGTAAAQAHPAPSAIPANRNTLTYHEDRNSRRFEASLTDSAMHGLGDVFGELFAQRGVGRLVQPGPGRTLVKDVVIDENKQLSPAAPAQPEQTQAPAAETNGAPKPPAEKERILKILSVNGETLELTDNRLKATTAADYYRRLTYLVLYAHELHGRAVTPRAAVVAILKEAKVYDTNCRTWLTKKNGFTVDSDDRFKLIAGAREQAIKALDDALNPTLTDEWHPDNKPTKTRAPRKKKA
jgi:hypothetical protein